MTYTEIDYFINELKKILKTEMFNIRYANLPNEPMMCPDCHAMLSQIVTDWFYSENPTGTIEKPKETGWYHNHPPNHHYLAVKVPQK